MAPQRDFALIRVCSFASILLLTAVLSFWMGFKSAPIGTQRSTIPLKMTIAFSQPYQSISFWIIGPMMEEPSPEPQTAKPVAKARFFSKYMETLIMAGR